MNTNTQELTEIYDFEVVDAFGKWCKVYNDGNHFIGSIAIHHTGKHKNKYKLTDEIRYFDNLYIIACKNGLTHTALYDFLKNGMLNEFPLMQDVDNFVEKHIQRKIHNFYARIKRFTRKAHLNKWNKFVTITYDDKKHTAESFKRKLKKCLSNLHCRRGWNYMGVFEYAPETQRLHFHALMYIPNGQMVGEVVERKDYSTAQKKMQTTLINTFFEKKFGRNDFEDLSAEDLKFGHALEYLTKYLHKTNEKIVYSRGIPTELSMYIANTDIATEFEDFVLKFVLFDDCIDSDCVYTPYEPPQYEQSSLELCCV